MLKMKKIFKKFIACGLAVAGIFVSMAGVVNADTGMSEVNKRMASGKSKVWNGKADTSWYTGDKDSYDISTPEQLAGVSVILDGGDTMKDITLNLTRDITLNNVSNYSKWDKKAPKNKWNPIGWVGGPVRGYFPFRGHLNGNGHTITGMYVDAQGGDEQGGLFCYVSGSVISNLKITKSYIKSKVSAGAIAGHGEYSYFEKCEVSDCTVLGEYGVGGIVGTAEQIHATSVLTYGLFLGLGIVINPLYWSGAKGDDDPLSGTYFVNCKVVDSTLKVETDGSGDMFNGGIVGFAGIGTGYYNCLVANNELGAMSHFGLGSFGPCGALMGSNSNFAIDHEIIVKNCYAYKMKRNDVLNKAKNQISKEVNTLGNPKKVSAAKLKSAAFAKKLGDGYVKGKKYPELGM